MPRPIYVRQPASEADSTNKAEQPAQHQTPSIPTTGVYRKSTPVTPSNILNLQRTVGNQAVQRLIKQQQASRTATPRPATVQRYYNMASDQYTGTQSTGANAGNMFNTQGTNPLVKDNNTVRYDSGSATNPPLLVADDDTMAINDTAEEAKEFYATDTVIEEANKDLAKASSPLKLDNTSSGNTLTIKGKTLKKVGPVKNERTTALLANEFADFGFHRCVYIANRLMGNSNPTGYNNVAVFNNLDTGVGVHKEKVKPNDMTIPEADKLAAYMSKSEDLNGNTELSNTMSGPNVTAPVGQEYGTKLGKGQLDAKAQELGVNQFARAKVGEGYTTASISAGKDNTKDDYSKLLPSDRPTVNREEPWGYHFAAVAAESENKADHITMENYNRSIELKKATKQLLDKIEVDFAAQISAMAIPDKLSEGERVKFILTEVGVLAGKEKVQAEAAAKAALDNPVGTMWFFKMFGSKVGQSFHEAQAASGYFVNPLTMRVRPPDRTSPITVFFSRSSSTVKTAEANRLFIPGVINSMNKDLDQFDDRKIVITGYANKKAFKKSNTTLAQNRADSIKTLLVNRGIPAGKITVINGGDSTNFPTTGGKSQTDANRRAEVVME